MIKFIKFYIVVFLFGFNAQMSMAQSNSNNIKIITSPDKVVAASALNGANTIPEQLDSKFTELIALLYCSKHKTEACFMY